MLAMKRIAALFALGACLFLVQNAHAAELEPSGTPMRKLQRGFLNVALSPIEVIHALDQEKNVDSVIPSWFAGLGRGSIYMVGRVMAGAFEMATFPLPLPSGYEPIVEPEFIWLHLDDQTACGTIEEEG